VTIVIYCDPSVPSLASGSAAHFVQAGLQNQGFTVQNLSIVLHLLYSLCRSLTQFSTIEVLVAMLMTRWEFRIVPCLAEGNASATCLKMLVMRFADVQ